MDRDGFPFLLSERGEDARALLFHPVEQQRAARRRHDGEDGQIRRRAQDISAQEIQPAEHDGIDPVDKEREHHAAALLDGCGLVGPRQVRHLQAERECGQRAQQRIQQRHDHRQHLFQRAARQHKDHAQCAKQHRCAGQHELHVQLRAQHLPRHDRQRLREPQVLALKRHRRRRHIVHRREQAHRRAHQHRHDPRVRAEHVLQQLPKCAALDEQRDARHRQRHDAEAAVEHIVRAGGKAAQLLAEQRPLRALCAHGLVLEAHLLHAAGRRGDLQEAARDAPQRQRQKRRLRDRHDPHRQPVARADAAKQVQQIRRATDLHAVHGGIFHQQRNERLRLVIYEIIRRQKQQRQNDGDEALVFQLQADARDHPAEQAREDNHDHGHKQHHQHAADDRTRRDRRHDPVHDHARHDDDRGVHQTQQIHAQQARGHHAAHRDRHRQQQIVVLGQVQTRIRAKHAAERAEQHRDQPHEQVVQPAHAGLGQRRAQAHGHEREHPAAHTHHQQYIQHDVGKCCTLGAHSVLFRVVEIVAENLRHLFFQQRFQHDASSSSRNTSSRLSSPLTDFQIWEITEEKEQHYQVTYTVEQRITEGESGKTVRSAYQVTVYVDGSGNLTIIQNPTITSVPVKSGYTPKAVQSDGTVDSITTEEINEFLTTFFKLYPTATAKELTYYVNDGVLKPVGKEYIFSELVNPVYNRSGNQVTASLAVKYLDNQTMTTQVSQFDLVLEKNGENWKIVK